MTRKGYVPHCPSPSCIGGYEHKLRKATSKLVNMPGDVSEQARDGEVIYRCQYCGLVWFQKAGVRPGLDARVAGWYDGPQSPNKFLRVKGPYDIRPQNKSWCWESR